MHLQRQGPVWPCPDQSRERPDGSQGRPCRRRSWVDGRRSQRRQTRCILEFLPGTGTTPFALSARTLGGSGITVVRQGVVRRRTRSAPGGQEGNPDQAARIFPRNWVTSL